MRLAENCVLPLHCSVLKNVDLKAFFYLKRNEVIEDDEDSDDSDDDEVKKKFR